MIIPLPVHAVGWWLGSGGALVLLVAVQLSVPGLYRPPVFKRPPLPSPPQTIISLPGSAARRVCRAGGAPVVRVDVQLAVRGVYRPPAVKRPPPRSRPQPLIPALRP